MRFVVITLAAMLAMLAVSLQRDADAAIDAQQQADVAVSPLDPAVFDPAPKGFPSLFGVSPYQDEFAAVAPLAGGGPAKLVSLPPLKLLDLAPAEPAREKAAPEAVQSDPTPSGTKQQAALSRQDLSPAFLMPGEAESFVLPEEPAPTVELFVLPPRRPRAADLAHRRSSLGRIAFATPTLAPMGHTLFCLNYPDECRIQKAMLQAGPITLTDERRAELERVNADVNTAIQPVNVSGVIADKWLIAPGSGNCNDYAVTKRHALLARGWPSRHLLLAEVVTTWGEHHLVLVVRTDKGDIVADSLDKKIRNWVEAPYRWVRVQTPENPKFWASIETPQPDLLAMAEQDDRL